MPYVPSEKTDGKAQDRNILEPLAKALADGIAQVAAGYKYDGAFLGEMNYALTRLIQHLPRSLQEFQGFKDETRYWMQAGMFGVLMDVMLEYKVRVNQAYYSRGIAQHGKKAEIVTIRPIIPVLCNSSMKQENAWELAMLICREVQQHFMSISYHLQSLCGH